MNQAGEERIVTTYSLDLAQKRVIATFSAPISKLAMASTEAVKMAQILLNCAKALDPESVKEFTWPGMDEKIELKAPVEAPAGGLPS